MMKRIWILAFFLMYGLAAGGSDALLHFSFDRSEESDGVTSRSGSVRLLTDQHLFLYQRGGLRISAGSQFRVPSASLPELGDSFTLNSWYYGSTRGLDNTLFYRGMFPRQPQIHCGIRNLSPVLIVNTDQGVRRIETTGYGHLISYPDRSVIADAGNTEVLPGCWNMVTYLFRKGDLEIYINGRLGLRKKFSSPAFVRPDRQDLHVGALRQQGTNLNKVNSDMLVNDLRLYGRALSSAEISALYQQEKGRYSSYPVQDSWSKLPACYDYIRRLIPGYDPDFQFRLKRTEEYLKRIPPLEKLTGRTRSALVWDQGMMNLSINGKFYAPLLFQSGSNLTVEKDFARKFEDFAAAGFVLYGGQPGSWHDFPHIWKGDGNYDFSLIDMMLRRLIALKPRGYVQLAFHPEPNSWFQRAHKKELELYYVTGRSGDELKIYFTGPMGSDIWLQYASRMLESMVRHVEAQDYAARVFDYKIFMSGGGEWYWPGCFTGGIGGYSEATGETFRSWLKKKYGTDKALQKAWNNHAVTLDNAQVPAPEFRMASEHFNFRDPVKARPCYDFRDYMSDRTLLNISTMTAAMKRGCGGRKTVTTYYGYPIHYSGSSMATQFTSAVYTLGRVLRLKTVDNIATPITYNNRALGEAGVNINPFNGSADLHGKLIWHENDLRTHVHPEPIFGRPDNWQGSCMQIRRGFALASTMRMGCWFLGLPKYAYHEEHIQEEMAGLQKQADAMLREDRSSAAQVALIYDEESMRHSAFHRNAIRGKGRNFYNSDFLGSHVRQFYNELFHAGAPFDSYLLSDISHPKMPDYKVYFFVNTFELTPEKLSAIRKKVCRNGAVAVWSYAPGMITAKGFGTEGMKALTGMNFGLEMNPRQVTLQITAKHHPMLKYGVNQFDYKVGPFPFVKDSKAEILGRADGKDVLAIRDFGSWKSIYTLMPFERRMIAGLYEYTGVHRYAKDWDVFSANRSYLMIHASAPGSRKFYLPRPADVTEVFTGQVLGRGVTSFTDDHLKLGTTRLYLVK